MNLQERVKADMIAAMKAKEKEKLGLLRVLSGEFATNEKKADKDRLEELAIVRKMSNNAKEMGNESEVQILDEYLPKMLDENAITLLVNEIITLNGYSGMKDMGNVMKELRTPNIDGKLASTIVRKLLSQ